MRTNRPTHDRQIILQRVQSQLLVDDGSSRSVHAVESPGCPRSEDLRLESCKRRKRNRGRDAMSSFASLVRPTEERSSSSEEERDSRQKLR